MRDVLAYISTASLAGTALGMSLAWSWARMVGRIVSFDEGFEIQQGMINMMFDQYHSDKNLVSI